MVPFNSFIRSFINVNRKALRSKHIVFMLTDDEEVHPSYDMGFWVKSPYFAGTLNKMFDKTWGAELSPDSE